MTAGRHLVLVGLMGTGKTTVGRLVAEQLDRPLRDSDDAVEATTGRTVRDIWTTEGEPAFRKLETAALLDSLAAEQPSVIAAAGGIVLAERNRKALREADVTVVWLHADTDVIVERAMSGSHRPLLDDDPEATLEQMATNRAPLYREVAGAIVDTGDRTPEDIAAEIVEQVRGD